MTSTARPRARKRPRAAAGAARESWLDPVAQAILDLIAKVPAAHPEAVAGTHAAHTPPPSPAAAAAQVARRASYEAGLLAGTLALPPGWLGLLTLLPDLMGVWRLQAQMVADIAALHGKTALLDRQAMLYCLFRHVAAQGSRDLVTRLLDRSLSSPEVQTLLRQIATLLGRRISQRAIGKSAARWVPLAGALGVAAYAVYDTRQVAQAALEVFGDRAPPAR